MPDYARERKHFQRRAPVWKLALVINCMTVPYHGVILAAAGQTRAVWSAPVYMATMSTAPKGLLMHLPIQLPDEPNSLAAIVADLNQPASVRDAAWGKLNDSHVPQIMKKAAARSHCRRCRHFIQDEGPSLLWQQLTRPSSDRSRFNPAHGSFSAWASVLLFRRLVSFHRSNCLRHRTFDPEKQTGQPPPLVWGQDQQWEREAEAVAEAIKEMSDQLRATLDQLGEQLARASSVNRHAVLLVQLRLAAAKLLKEARGAEVAEMFVPWRQNEADMAFKPHWPTLQIIWTQVRADLEHEPHWISGSRLCEVVRSVSGGRANLTGSLWLKWLERARAAAKERIRSDLWQKIFAPLLERS